MISGCTVFKRLCSTQIPEHDLIPHKRHPLTDICSPITSGLCVGCNQGPWLMVMKIIKICACHQHAVCCINQSMIGDEGNCHCMALCCAEPVGEGSMLLLPELADNVCSTCKKTKTAAGNIHLRHSELSEHHLSSVSVWIETKEWVIPTEETDG